MKVWVSRSQPGAERQAAELRGAGHTTVVAPVIEVAPVQTQVPPGTFQQVIFLSEHAVRIALGRLRAAGVLDGAEVLSVGARTAEVLEAAGVAATAPAEPTTEGLLALPALGDPRNRRILLVSGEGGRGLLQPALEARGADVVRYDCYRRLSVSRLDPAVLDCDAIIAGSGDGLRQIARLWFPAGGRSDVPVLVPSARVAALGVELGFTSLHDCAGADSRAWLRGLERLAGTGAT